MKQILSFFLLVFTTLLFFSSCHRDNEITPDDVLDFTSTTDYNTTNKNGTNLFATVNYYVLTTETGDKLQDSVTITVTPQDPDSFPKTITIDFGTGTVCYDGYIRKGKIILTVSGRWALEYIQPQTTITADFNNYYVKPPYLQEFVKREGQFSITYDGRDSSNHPVYIRDAINAKLIFEDSSTIEWNASHTCTWLTGYDTPGDNSDNSWEIEGSSNGINRHGRHYYTNITSPLLFERDCNGGSITKGILVITPEGLDQRIINFGNGDCDNTIIITVNGTDHTITN